MDVATLAPTNADQAQAWDGAEGDHWAAHPHQFDAVLEHYQPSFYAACDVRGHDRVLDVGCGTGRTTRDAARLAHAGSALGIDLSSRMLHVAEGLARAEELDNVRFERADAQVHPFERGSYDLVMSRTGAMFFGDPLQAFTNLRRALRPDGRLTLLTWQSVDQNPWMRIFAEALLGRVPGSPPHDAPGPFSMSDPDRVAALLVNAGFEDVELTGVRGPVTYGRSVDEAYELLIGVLGWMLQLRAPEDRGAASEALRRTLDDHVGPGGVQYDSATWLVTARRNRSGRV